MKKINIETKDGTLKVRPIYNNGTLSVVPAYMGHEDSRFSETIFTVTHNESGRKLFWTAGKDLNIMVAIVATPLLKDARWIDIKDNKKKRRQMDKKIQAISDACIKLLGGE